MTQKIKDPILNSLQNVAQDNTFIHLPKFLGTLEQKMFLFLISNLSPDSMDSKKNCILRLFAKDFTKSSKLKTPSEAYLDIQKTIQSLQKKVLTISTVKNNKPVTIHISLLSYTCHFTTEGYVDLKINPDILPFLFELKSYFAKHKSTEEIMPLVDKYPISEIQKKNPKTFIT